MDIEETHTVLIKKYFFVASIYFSSKIMPNTSVSEEVKREENMGLQRDIQHIRDQRPHL